MRIIHSFYLGIIIFALGMGVQFGLGFGLISLGVSIFVTEAIRAFITEINCDE